LIGEKMKKLAVVSLLLIVGCTRKPVFNIQTQYVPTKISNEQQSLAEVQKAILSAIQERGWSSRIVNPGLIEASILVRTHSATVEIQYTKSTYSITYKASENLKYRRGRIHRNYNGWVARLARAIQAELSANSQEQ
jgi:hypothetical protein